ncbi:hypothetical protein ACGP04_01365 [Piscirickettsia salmonis]|uniref:hypothetical protein n=1 Tax=Piscirickettsia salmonis TaxID=1238 RepID=UPI000F092713|nr:hypothetical protein DA717_06165 [Piscirickettsiaceae bacterium NZ-RLO2]
MPRSKKLTAGLLKQSITAAAQDSTFQAPTTLQKILKANHIRYIDLDEEQWDRLDESIRTIITQFGSEDNISGKVQAVLDEFNELQREALQVESASDEEDDEHSELRRRPRRGAFDEHPPHRRRAAAQMHNSLRTEYTTSSTASLLQGGPVGGWGAPPQRQTLATPSTTPPPPAAATTRDTATKRRRQTQPAAQQPAPTPAQGGEPSPSPEPQPQQTRAQAPAAAPAPQQSTGAQLTAPAVQLDDSFLARTNQRFQRLTGKSTITCQFSSDKSQLIATEGDQEITHVGITRTANGLSIQHEGTELTRQLAASAAVAAVTATPGAKIQVKSTGGKLSDKEIKVECQALLNAGAHHDQLDLSDLPSKLQTEIQQLQPQQPQQQRETQFTVKPPKPPKDPLRPFEALATEAARSQRPPAPTPASAPVDHSPNG